MDNAYAASTTVSGGAGSDSLTVNGVNISGTAGEGLNIFDVETVNISNSTFNNNADPHDATFVWSVTFG